MLHIFPKYFKEHHILKFIIKFKYGLIFIINFLKYSQCYISNNHITRHDNTHPRQDSVTKATKARYKKDAKEKSGPPQILAA